jgi:hypothetical protein
MRRVEEGVVQASLRGRQAPQDVFGGTGRNLKIRGQGLSKAIHSASGPASNTHRIRRRAFNTPDAIQQRLEWLATLRAKGISSRAAVVTTPQRSGISLRAAVKLEALGIEMRVYLDMAEARAWLAADLAGDSQLA